MLLTRFSFNKSDTTFALDERILGIKGPDIHGECSVDKATVSISLSDNIGHVLLISTGKVSKVVPLSTLVVHLNLPDLIQRLFGIYMEMNTTVSQR